MRMTKKITSIVLAVMMVVSMMSVMAFSANAVGEFVPKSDYLTFTAVEAGSSVTLKVASGSNLQYSLDGGELIPYTPGTRIDLVKGDSVSFRGNNTTFNSSNYVSIDGKVACSGNVMSLRLDDDGMSQGLSANCFSNMFVGCAGLTAAPELPETILAGNCYENMFYACTNLTAAPELPATALAPYCYSGMFAGCVSLTKAPELPATSLVSGCYERMFYRCMKLTKAPELPATELASYCYNYMFAACDSIKLSETKTDEYSIPYSVPSGGNGTPPSSWVLKSALRNMFDGTGGTFTGGTPEFNKTYYRPAVKYTVTWLNEDGTTIDTTSVYEGTTPTHADPTKAEDANNTYTFAGWTPEVVAATADATYTAQFDATPKHTVHTYTANPTFNWTQDASTGDWDCDTLTLTCTGCDLTQDYEVYAFSFGGGGKSSAVTCTANADGSYTYSVSKTVDGTKYEDSKTYNANGVVKSATQLKAAAKKGGSWELGNDIDQAVGISCADGFVLDGNNYTVTRHSNSATSAVFVAANKNASFTLNDLTIDGIANQTEVRPAIASAQSNPNSGNVINLNNVKIINWDFDQDNNGAVLAWGQATVNMTNCDIDTDSDYDVWGGAASTINVDGGKAGTVYLNGGTSSATVDNGASVTVETSKPESVTIAPGYALNDNGDGTYTVVIDNSSPLNPIEKAAADINDGNAFGLECDYLKGTLLGVQKKTVAGEETSSQEGEKNIRFVAVLDTDLIQTMQDADDYGFVLAKANNTDKTYAEINYDAIKAGDDRVKTISARGTFNNVCGNTSDAVKYGDPTDASGHTDYKYITCAVNNMGDNDKVVARFYYKKGDKVYYAKYAGHNYQYTGCISTADAT